MESCMGNEKGEGGGKAKGGVEDKAVWHRATTAWRTRQCGTSPVARSADGLTAVAASNWRCRGGSSGGDPTLEQQLSG
jgi:hypothetical protein